MNPLSSCRPPALPPVFLARRRGERRGAFALVITLLILSLLVIVAVSYLSSMSAEHQAADAYASSADAEQAARAGVDSATAMLAECLRDFPDSVTVWDPQQSINYGSSSNSAVVNSAYNEGTSLYLRAVPSAQDSTAYAVALPPRVTYTNGGTSYAANDPYGNTPSNLACENFVLPLISGWPNGQARLSTARAQYYASNPDATSPINSFPVAMNLKEPDPTKQNWVDLNGRRFGKSATYPNGDVQGYIGSPPGWTGTAPKPARAYWVPVKGSDGLITSRYAFWIDDESFRLNTSLAGGPTAANSTAAPPTSPPDNAAQATPYPSPAPQATPFLAGASAARSLQPSDLMLLGTLTSAGDTGAANDVGTIMSTRGNYPGYFFPDPLAFTHAFDGTTPPTQLIDTVRYLTTNQSGALNLTRHGSQRLNLNSTISTPTDPTTTAATIQKQVDQLVQTMEFHLPYFGERFYRMDLTKLNATNQVPGSPKLAPFTVTNDHSQIYYYKVAANLRDYVDSDCQPTMVGVVNGALGKVMGPPTGPLEGPTDPATSNEIWAQGKDSSPLIQEVSVRYRPVVGTTSTNPPSPYPKGHYDLLVDYYIEFWNMTDRDIYAVPQPSPNAALPNLGGATIFVRDQQTWTGYVLNASTSAFLEPDPAYPNGTPMPNSSTYPPDCQIDLANPISDGKGATPPNGVVFRAGAVTVITTDPDYASYTYREFPPLGSTPPTNGPGDNRAITGSADHVANPANLYYCPVIGGTRHYVGKVTDASGTNSPTAAGMMLGGEFSGTTFAGTEVSLVNSLGYLDVIRGAINKTGGPGTNFTTNTFKFVGTQGHYNDYGFSGALMGNVTSNTNTATASEMGDPRTNNEQLLISINAGGADGTAFVHPQLTLGAPNYPSVLPDQSYPWGDYYTMAAHYTLAADKSLVPTVNALNAPAVNADAPLTSIGQLGDVFDPARLPGVGGINYSRGGGRTFKIGQHDDRYSNDPSSNASNNGIDNISASNGWAAWRLADIFDVADPIELPGRININGVQRDNGAALLAMLQGFRFQPQTSFDSVNKVTPLGTDPVIHGDGHNTTLSPAGSLLNTSSTDTSHGSPAMVKQMIARLQNTTPANGPSGPFFERGEFGELGLGTSALFGSNPQMTSDPVNDALVSGVDMDKTFDHSREELFRRIAQMICTRGDTFTVYAMGQSIVQPSGTTAATADTAAKKITGTQRMRVTFRLMPQIWDPQSGAYKTFHPAYSANADGTVKQINNFTTASAGDASGVLARFAKPDRYNVQIIQAVSY